MCSYVEAMNNLCFLDVSLLSLCPLGAEGLSIAFVIKSSLCILEVIMLLDVSENKFSSLVFLFSCYLRKVYTI